MAVNIYKDGQWHSLAGNRIWSSENNEWVQVKDIDQLRFNSQWNTIGYQGSDNPSIQVPDSAPEPSYKKVAYSSDGNEPTLGSGNRIIYVSPNGSGDGTSWVNATDIDGMNYLLQMSSPGDIVYLLGGTYQVSSTIFVPNGVKIYGGFNPDNPTWSTRYNMSASRSWETILECSPSSKFPLFKFLENSSSVARTVSSVSATGFSALVTSESEQNVTVKNCLFNDFGSFSYSGILSNDGIYHCGNVSIGGVTAGSIRNVIVESKMSSTVHIDGNIAGTYKLTILHNGSGEVRFTSSSINNTYVHTDTGSIVFANKATIQSNCVLSSEKGYLHAEDCTVEGAKIYVKGNVYAKYIGAKMNGNAIASKAIVVGSRNVEATHVDGSKFKSCECVKTFYSFNSTYTGINEIWTDISYNDLYSSVIGSIVIYCIYKCTFVNCEDKYENDKLLALNKYTWNNQIVIANDLTLNGDKITSIQDICCDNSIDCNFCLVNGKLCCFVDKKFSLISENQGWTAVSGFYSYKHRGYGIRDGKLYCIDNGVTQIGSSSGWTAISGFSSYYNEYAYGIRDGKLYRIADNVIQVGSSSGWTAISGYSCTRNRNEVYAYGICDGKLYRIADNVIQVGSSSGWTAISGYFKENDEYSIGICEGKLYKILNYRAYLISDLSGWTYVSGICLTKSSQFYAYGICNGDIYKINGNNECVKINSSNINDESEIKRLSVHVKLHDCDLFDFYDKSYFFHNLNGCFIQSTNNYYNFIVLLSNFDYRMKNLFKNYINNYMSFVRSIETKFINCNMTSSELINCLKINCSDYNKCFFRDETFKSSKEISIHSTFVNSKINQINNDGNNNVFYNCEGIFPHERNAVTNAVDAKVNLGPTTMNTEFVNKGFTPSIGIQDVGECPDPDENPDGYNEWMSQFGDWHPKESSLLLNPRFKGTYDEDITTDLDGNVRNDPPTLGCYEYVEPSSDSSEP